MTDAADLAALQAAMEAAAAAMDFEGARRLRDRIAYLRGGGDPNVIEAVDDAALTRQQPGAMGLGTSQQRVVPPPGWRAPPKPDPMTKNRNRR